VDRRTGLVAGLAVAVLAGLTAALVPAQDSLAVASVALLYLVPVVAVAVLGGLWLALVAAVAADLLVNFFFVPPLHTFTVERRDNVITLVVYLLVAAAVALAVDVAARQRERAARRETEASLLARFAAEPVADQSLPGLLDQVRATFGMDAVALVSSGNIVARVGTSRDGPPTLSTRAGAGIRLVGWGPELFGEDRRTLSRLAAAAARALEARQLAGEAAQARELADIDRVRAALLASVGHDLRTPLAAIKAAVSSLRQPDIDWPAAERAELLATVEESSDRLDALVDNLLSMSRLQAGVLSVHPQPVALDGVVAQAVLNTTVEVDVPEDLPLVRADPGLLERAVANLVANAVAVSPAVLVQARRAGDVVELRVIDHGPGVPAADRERIFAPFQRLNDHTATGGLGLGLAIARGFTDAMGGTLTPTDTPGGGLTQTITLSLAADLAR
jgi:two-component system sensor histidine kinase KdpD